MDGSVLWVVWWQFKHPLFRHSIAERIQLRPGQLGRLGLAVLPPVDGGKAHPQFTGQALLTQRQLPANFLDQSGKVLTVRLHRFAFAGS